MSNTISSDMVAVVGRQTMTEGVSIKTKLPFKCYNTWVIGLDDTEPYMVTLWSKFKHCDVLKPTEYTNKAGDTKVRYDLAPDQDKCKEAFDHLTNYVTVGWNKSTAT